MTPRAACLLLLAASLTLATPAHADEVKLTTGRSMQGTVVEETPERVVLKTPKGRVTLPRRLIKSITRQDPAQTALALAKERLRAGALDEAARLYRKATRGKDPKVTREAKTGLLRVQRARARRAAEDERRAEAEAEARAKAKAKARRTDARPKPKASARPRRWGYAEACAALRKGDGRLAQALLDPLRPSRAQDPVFQYLLGRAHHLQGGTKHAYGAFRKVVEAFRVQRKLPPVYLPPVAERVEELARRSFGEDLRSGAPGIDDEWQRVEIGKRFALYHKLDFHHPVWGTPHEKAFFHFRGHLEAAHQAVMKQFELKPGDLPGGTLHPPRVIVFVYPSSDAHAAASGSAHARHRRVPDGWLHIIEGFMIQVAIGPPPSNRRRRRNNPIDALKHKTAHTILRDAFQLPAWAEEAAAAHVSSPGNANTGELKRVAARGDLPTVEAFLTKQVQPKNDATRFDAQALLIFRALVDLRGSIRKALDLCEAIRAKGAKRALAAVRLDTDRVAQACRKIQRRERPR